MDARLPPCENFERPDLGAKAGTKFSSDSGSISLASLLLDIPLYLNSMVPADMPLQSRVRVQLQDIDWVKLEVGVRVLGRIEGEPILDEAFEDLPEDEVIGAEVVGQMATEVDAELPAQISVETPIEKL